MRLAPRDFWSMTPRELAHALAAVFGEPQAPLTRARFEALAARFPDAHNASAPRTSRA